MASFEDYPEPPPFHRKGNGVYMGDECIAVANCEENADAIVVALKTADTLYRCPVCKIFVGASAMPHHVTRHVTEAIANERSE
jgi:hypothetical protein